jgi:hypothetical protein
MPSPLDKSHTKTNKLNDETEAEARDPTELNLNSSKVEANA